MMTKDKIIPLFKEIFGDLSWIDNYLYQYEESNNPNLIFAHMTSIVTNANNLEKYELLQIQPPLIDKELIVRGKLDYELNISNALVIFNINDKNIDDLLQLTRIYKDKFDYEYLITGKYKGYSDIKYDLEERLNHHQSYELNSSVDHVITIGLFKFIHWLQIRDLSLNFSNNIESDGKINLIMDWSYKDTPIVN